MKTQIEQIKTTILKAIEDREFTVKGITLDDVIIINVCGLKMAIRYMESVDMAFFTDNGCDFSFETKGEDRGLLLEIAEAEYAKVKRERIEAEIEKLKKQL